MQGERTAVPAVYYRVLGDIGVVYHAILAVFDISVNLHIVVLTEPGAEFVLVMRGPKNGTVEQPGILEAVRQAADIYAAALFAFVGSQLYLFLPLAENKSAG